jgi:hypothetical protein
MGYKYPPPPATTSGDNVTISRFLNNPTLVARRLRTLFEQRFIADTLLSGRYEAAGGSIQYETGEGLYTDRDPEAVAPGSVYPETGMEDGTSSIAQTVKWGQDALVTDESISRRKMSPVNKALLKLTNQAVKNVDSIALAAIASAVTAGVDAANPWTIAGGATAEEILLDVTFAKGNILALNEGYDPDVVVLDDLRWAYAMAKFASAGLVPRETGAQNPVLTGEFPVIAGMRWLATPNLPVDGKVIVADSTMLGGMADEDIGGPGYINVAGMGVQTKTIREDKEDQWRLRARRITVPIVNEPAAARTINNA